MTVKVKSCHRLSVAERRAKVAACLISEKMTIKQAAEAAGCSVGTAHADYAALRAEWQGNAGELIDLERQRLLYDCATVVTLCWDVLDGRKEGLRPGQALTGLLKALEFKAQILGITDNKLFALQTQSLVVLPPEDPLSGGVGLLQVHGGNPVT